MWLFLSSHSLLSHHLLARPLSMCLCFALLVEKVGLPSDKAQYIHRLGRTARAGKAGRGILLLCDFEWVSRDAFLIPSDLRYTWYSLLV